MVASFDYVRLLKEEYAGNCYSQTDDEVLVPDFRVVTTKEGSFLIETKNHFSNDPMRRYRIGSEWNQWMLNDPDRFRYCVNYAEIEFMQAMKQNEMAVLGDYGIGTTCPLILKLTVATCGEISNWLVT